MRLVCETPARLNHADTILYEIYMLRFAAQRLLEHHQQANWRDQKDAWVYLEAFLAHYWNLIEFLGKPKTRSDTLTVASIWKLLNLAEPIQTRQIQKDGEELHAKYEEVDDCISRYVSHPTIKRIDPRSWRIDVMSEEIEPLLTQVEAALPSHAANDLLQPVQAIPLGPLDSSTTVSTRAVESKPIDPPKQFE